MSTIEATEYAKKCMDIMRNSFTGIAVDIGIRLGLFDALLAHSSTESPVTSQQLADKVNLRERWAVARD